MDALRVSMFNIVSVITGSVWLEGLRMGRTATTLFAFLMMAGACSGSTSGGKIFRFQIAMTGTPEANDEANSSIRCIVQRATITPCQ